MKRKGKIISPPQCWHKLQAKILISGEAHCDNSLPLLSVCLFVIVSFYSLHLASACPGRRERWQQNQHLNSGEKRNLSWRCSVIQDYRPAAINSRLIIQTLHFVVNSLQCLFASVSFFFCIIKPIVRFFFFLVFVWRDNSLKNENHLINYRYSFSRHP